jgi:outer membrane protein assembly factor BamB
MRKVHWTITAVAALMIIPILLSSSTGQANTSFQIATPESDSDDWPTFHHDNAHIGFSTSSAPDTNHILWTMSLPDEWLEGSSPAIVEGKLFVGSNKKVYCLDSITGEIIWNRTIGGEKTSPAVSNGRVYIGSSNSHMYCLNASSGEVIWNYGSQGVIDSSPTIAYNRVYFGSEDRRLYCLNANTGAMLWTYGTLSPVRDSPSVVDGRVYFNSLYAYTGGYHPRPWTTYCLDAFSGERIWSIDTEGYGFLWSSPTVVDGRVLVSSYNHIYCLNSSNGAVIWKIKMSAQFSTPAYAYDRIYVGTHNREFTDPTEAWIRCYNATGGDLEWQYKFGSTFQQLASPLVADDKVYMGYVDYFWPPKSPTIVCFDAFNGEVIWSHTENDGLWTSPSLADGILYISTRHKVIAFGEDVYPPEIDIETALDDATIRSAQLNLTWQGEDIHSEIDRYEVKVDDREWVDVGNSTFFLLSELEDGDHAITVMAVDGAGQMAYDEVNITVNTSILGGPGLEDDTIVFTFAAIFLFLGVFIGLSLWKEGEK